MNELSIAERIIVGICLTACLGTMAHAQKLPTKTAKQKENILSSPIPEPAISSGYRQNDNQNRRRKVFL